MSAVSVPTVVRKRDGRTQQLDRHRLVTSLRRAWRDVHGTTDTVVVDQLAADALTDAAARDVVAAQELHDSVSELLRTSGHHDVADAYVRHAVTRELARDSAADVNAAVGRLLERDRAVVNENANKDSDTFNTQRDLTAGAAGKAIGLRMLPPHVANAHLRGDLHYHDLDYHPYQPMTNCCLIDFPGMLAGGFRIGNAEVSSPRSIGTATAQIAQIIANVASSQYGGCTVNRIDELLAPYAAMNYDKHLADARRWVDGEHRREQYARERTAKDIYDAMQSLEYEVNTLFSSNGQTPFTSVGFGLGTGWFERQIQQAVLQVRIDGLGVERRTAIFPKLIFTLRRGVNLEPGDPNYDIKTLAVRCATKRMYPDVLSYDKIVELTGSFKAPMGCRSFLQGWTDEHGNDVVEGRMNLGVVTVNIPRVALQAGGDMGRFWSLLDERLDVARDALLFRIDRCKQAAPRNAPILYVHGAFGRRLDPDGDVDELFRAGRATVSLGYIGLYEAAAAFFGGAWENDPVAKEFTLSIVRRLAEHAKQWTARHGYQFSVYATPSESLTDRFARLDLERFGHVPDITDKGYYTNSFHYDVRKAPTPFEKLDFEAPYTQHSSGGFIHYCEYPVLVSNPRALEAVWDYAYDRVGYLGTNTPIDHCLRCDHRGDFEPTEHGFRCPACGNTDPRTCDVVKRTCGYLGNPQQRPMVAGRHKEISSRVKHMEA